MPIGTMQTNNFLHSTLDLWNDQVFFHEKAYPAGYFAASALNISVDAINEMKEAGGALVALCPFLLTEDESVYHRIWHELRQRMLALAEQLRRYEPFSLNDWENEQHLIDAFFTKDIFPLILTPDSREQDFFMGYVHALVEIPAVLHHFMAAGRFFELDYLRRLNKRNETHFAVAAHDCFNSDLFWKEMNSLTDPEIAPFTISPQIRSSYMFARDPKRETEMVFVNRVFFTSYMDFLVFDLFNGLHHGHAPSQCRNCGKYFLTTTGHKTKYCNGTAPQDPHLTCRQYGAQHGDKESNHNHPIYILCKTRTNTIRKHAERGKIDKPLRDEALKVATELRERAFMDNAYAEDEYQQDMALDAIYNTARERLAEKRITSP